MKTIAVIPIYGRLPLIKHTINRLYKKNGVDLVICIGETEREKILCESLNAVFAVYPNKPLGAKWNHGFKLAKAYYPESVLFVGSSDWLEDYYLETASKHLNEFDMIGTLGCYMLDLKDKGREKRLVHWPGYGAGEREEEPIGIGRLLSNRILDKIEWEPFDNKMDNSLDWQMWNKILKAGGKVKIIDAISMAISTDAWVNKHTFENHWINKYPSKRISEVDQFCKQHFNEYDKIF